MSYRLIKGEFHIHHPDIPSQGPEPDGDTVKFDPDDRDLVEGLTRAGRAPRFNGRGKISIRFEGIDALETHFEEAHQEMVLAEAARDEMLGVLRFGEIAFFAHLPARVDRVQNHPTRGYLLAKGIDPHGRIIAFVFAGNAPEPDGSDVFVEPARALESVNAHMLRVGQAYPAFYTGLPIVLKDALAGLVRDARLAGRGLWPTATADAGSAATVPDLETAEGLVMWPKLFRRLVRYFGSGHAELSEFDAWLRADPQDRDDAIMLPDRELGNMHDVIEVVGDDIRLRFQPEDLVIVPDGELAVQPAPSTPRPRLAPASPGAIRIVAALANPAGADAGNERVTLLNAGPTPIDLAGWQLTDAADQGRDTVHGIIGSGRSMAVRLRTVRLGNAGDRIILFGADGAEVDRVDYTADQTAPAGWSIIF